MYMPGTHQAGETEFVHPLQDLIFTPKYRRGLLLELRHTLFSLDKQIVDKCNVYLAQPDTGSMLHQNVLTYMQGNHTRRPMFVAVCILDKVLSNPNFLQEFYILLVIFLQFTDIAKKEVAKHTLEPIFTRFFYCNPNFYSRFKTFVPGALPMQTVNQFIRNEMSLLLVATSVLMH